MDLFVSALYGNANLGLGHSVMVYRIMGIFNTQANALFTSSTDMKTIVASRFCLDMFSKTIYIE